MPFSKAQWNYCSIEPYSNMCYFLPLCIQSFFMEIVFVFFSVQKIFKIMSKDFSLKKRMKKYRGEGGGVKCEVQFLCVNPLALQI